MKSMQLKKLAVISTLVAFVGMMFAPVAFAMPITPNLAWSPGTVVAGSTTTAIFGVADKILLPNSTTINDPDCPPGQTFTGTITVTEPDNTSISTTSVTVVACGTTNLSAIYPTAFTGTKGTTELGTYTAVWKGTTTATVGGKHPTFNVIDNFVVVPPVTHGAPEFAAPAMFVAAFGLVVVALIKKGNLLHLPGTAR
jgi:hypothetical protein